MLLPISSTPGVKCDHMRHPHNLINHRRGALNKPSAVSSSVSHAENVFVYLYATYISHEPHMNHWII